MKIGVYIDNSNLFREIKDNFDNVKIDYKRLKDYIESVCHSLYGENLIITFNVYASERKIGDTPQALFYRKLQYFGYNVKTFELQEHNHTLTENGIVDIALSVDVAVGVARDFFDVVMLVAGDGGYSYLADVVRDNGKVMDVMFSTRSLSDKLRRKVHHFVEITSAVIDWIKFLDPATECISGSEPKTSP